MNIDAVITWVDGNDPKHRQKREKYGSKDTFDKKDVGGETRFSSLGEICWCVVSLNKFAPWLHKIYIVTDEQDPKIENVIRDMFPDGYIPMEIVDHKVIFRGYEQYLPVFNSVALETITWRIPRLSDCFIEFNDDFMLAAPVSPDDFFVNETTPVCYATKRNLAIVKFTRLLKRRRDGSKRITFKGLMANAATLAAPVSFFFNLKHTPRALRRDFYESCFEERPDLVHRNLQFRFRNIMQFTPQELQYLMLYKNGNCVCRDPKSLLFYLQPKKKRNYVRNKLAKLHKMKHCKFLCFNSIDLGSEADQALIFEELNRRFG